MPIVYPQSGPLAEELAKWEQHRTKYVPDDMVPGNPYVYRPYPRAMYKAVKKANGKVVCMETPPNSYAYLDEKSYERACLEVESFNRQCYSEVKSEEEHKKARNEGWRDTPTEALQFFEACEQAIGNAAAEANWGAKRMSARAQDELKQANEQTHEHVTDIVGSSGKTRGRKAKIKPVTTA